MAIGNRIINWFRNLSKRDRLINDLNISARGAKQIYTAQSVEDFNGSNESYTFTGEWENGKPNGYGIKIYSDGTTNRGYFKDGKLHGYGVCHYSDGTISEGYFVDDLKEGYGVRIGLLSYRGDYKNDKFYGKGILSFNNELDYVGDIQEDILFHGVGMLEYHNEGAYYVGQLSNGKREGFGKLIYRNGDFYEGEWKDGIFHGEGSFTYPSKGYRFECTFINGDAHGNARRVSLVDKRVLKEEYWVNGKKQ